MRCSCSGPPENLVTVTPDRYAVDQITRRGDEIVVGGPTARPSRCRGGVPTVLNTDAIRVSPRGVTDFVNVLLRGGPFAPGATPETEGASEVEVEFGGEEPFGTVVGTSRADEFHWNLGGTPPGLNLNPGSADDQDVDLAVTKGGILVGFYSRSGREAMTGSSRPPAGYFPAPALYFPPTSTRWVSEETISWSRPHPRGRTGWRNGQRLSRRR